MSITITFPLGYKPVLKHGEHDQSSHGSWATGTVSDLKSETIPTNKLDRGIVSGEKVSAKITVQNESFTISQINEKYDDGVVVMNMSIKNSENKNIARLSASNQLVDKKEYAKIGYVEVRTDYQRKGVATAMLNFARANMMDGIKIEHDRGNLSSEGKAWANVTKHGEHDQSDHGSWATGQGDFDDEKDYDAAYSTYSEKYGVDKEGNTVGMSDEEIGAIEDYTSEGYKGLNSMLRAGSSLYDISQEERIEYLAEVSTSTGERAEQEFREKNDFPDNYELTPPEVETAHDNYATAHKEELDSYVFETKEFAYNDEEFRDRIDSLDRTISDAPVLFGDKNLYRAMSNNVLEGMKEGDIVTDKGYLSTTRANLTVDTFTREQVGSIKDSDDTVAVILPNASKNGRGFAVDMWAKLSNRETDTRNREQEILLPRNTPLKFIGYKTDVGTEARVAVFQRMDK